MRRITKEHKLYVEEKAPAFVKEVARLKQSPASKHEQPLRTTLADFRGDVTLLYACLWYAATEGVDVLIYPRESAGSRRN